MGILRTVLILGFAFSVIACSRSSKLHSSESPETYTVVEGSLGFDIQPVDNTQRVWVASYASQGKPAKFRIELVAAQPSQNAAFDVGRGQFLPEAGSEPKQFLTDLAKVLEAKKIPEKRTRSVAVPFEYATLSENQCRSKDGGFSDSPRGCNWTLLKLFFGDDQGEVYLNYNLDLKKAEFSIKDPDYGDFIIGQLAKIL